MFNHAHAIELGWVMPILVLLRFDILPVYAMVILLEKYPEPAF